MEQTDTISQQLAHAFSDGSVGGTIAISLLLVLLTVVLTKAVTRIFHKRFSPSTRFLAKVINGVIIAVAVACVFMTIDPLKKVAATALASTGILAVVLGLAAQETLGDVFGGISILCSKLLKPGEFIEIPGMDVMGAVESITLRHVTVRDVRFGRIVIPNSLLTKDVLRLSFCDGCSCQQLYVDISYDSDMEKALELLETVVGSHPLCYDPRTEEEKAAGRPKVLTRVVDLGEYSVKLCANYFVEDPLTIPKVTTQMRIRLKRAYDENGIEIPYPYHNVIMK